MEWFGPVCVLIFVLGLITLLEIHLTYLVRRHFPDESWRSKLKPKRVEAAEGLLGERRRRNEEIDLTSCLQFADKRDLILGEPELCAHLGLPSKTAGRKSLRSIERLRDRIAHAHDVVAGSTWMEVADAVADLESMIGRSDHQVEDR